MATDTRMLAGFDSMGLKILEDPRVLIFKNSQLITQVSLNLISVCWYSTLVE